MRLLVPYPAIMLIRYGAYITYITSSLIQLWYYVTRLPHILLLAMQAGDLHGPTTARISKKPTKLTGLWVPHHYDAIGPNLAHMATSTIVPLELWNSCNQ